MTGFPPYNSVPPILFKDLFDKVWLYLCEIGYSWWYCTGLIHSSYKVKEKAECSALVLEAQGSCYCEAIINLLIDFHIFIPDTCHQQNKAIGSVKLKPIGFYSLLLKRVQFAAY